jgi:hypothetical protein
VKLDAQKDKVVIEDRKDKVQLKKIAPKVKEISPTVVKSEFTEKTKIPQKSGKKEIEIPKEIPTRSSETIKKKVERVSYYVSLQDLTKAVVDNRVRFDFDIRMTKAQMQMFEMAKIPLKLKKSTDKDEKPKM